MSVSVDLISQFAKLTKEDKKSKSESTVYGEAVEYNGRMYVRIDGSELLTPVETTADIANGERVTVLIKNHNATVTGNISSPSARTDDVKDIDAKVTEIGNKIADFDIVVADKVTTKEFDAQKARIDTLVSDNVKIKQSLTAAEADIDTIQAENVTITENLEAATADIENLKTTKLDADMANAKFATIENLNATTANLENLSSKHANFETATANNFSAINGSIENLQTNKLDSSVAEITYAKIADLNATNASIDTLESTFGDFEVLATDKFNSVEADIQTLTTEKLSASDITGKFANIEFSNIGKAAIEHFFSQSGLIENVVVGEQTVTGKLVGVTISGDLIEGNTIVADKLVIKGDDGLYYKLNTDGVTTEANQTDYNSINGQIIKAKSITASKISVTDLVAFGATIGGFNIGQNSIYSGVKESVDNSTRGIYMDKDGQIAIGDSENFIKYYVDQNGEGHLEISAQTVTMSTGLSSLGDDHTEEKIDLATSILELIEETNSNASDLANYIASTNSELENLQGQIDGSITTWFYEYEPTTTNLPTSGWTTTNDKNVHLGDLFYDTITGYCYRWQVQNNVYSWNRITDVDVTKALADAAAAQTTANNKRRVFISTPTPPYDIGDLWAQGSTGDLMRCKTAKTSGQSYAASDWTKASKYTDDTVANQAKEAANAAQSDVDAVKLRMSSAETKISQNEEQIALRATKTEVTETLSGYYTKSQTEAAIQVKADSISQNVSNTYATKTELNTTNSNVTAAKQAADNAQQSVDNLEIGGRNYILKSDKWSSNGSTATGITQTVENGVKKIVAESGNGNWNSFIRENVIEDNFKEGDTFTFAVEIKSDDSTKLPSIYFKSGMGYYSMKGTVSSEYSWCYYTGIWKDANNISFHFGWQSAIGTYYLRRIIFIKGNKLLDWSHAPEDVDADIAEAQQTADNAQADVDAIEVRVTSAETQISQNASDISLRATKTEVSTAKSEAISTAASDAATKANNAKTSAISTAASDATTKANNALSSAKSYADAQIQISANSIISSVSSTYTTKTDFNNLKIGGRNLFKGYDESEIRLNDYQSVGGFTQFANCLTFNPCETVGETYTISFWAKSPNGSTALFIYNQNGNPRHFYFPRTTLTSDLTDEWEHFSYTFTNVDMGESYTDNICNRIEICAPNQLGVLVKKIKVEVGNRATDWSPAPEDMATLEEVNDVYTLADSAENKAVNAQTLIEQLSDSIATLVTDSNGESLMVQTESGWTFSTKQIQDTVDMTSESLDLLTKDMGDINSAVGILQQAVSDLGVLSEYVKITTYEDEPCIELGEGDSDFKLLITNTRILFMEGSNILAYMTNQEVHIKKTVIEEELQQGGFVWKVRSNGNMGLMWKGVSS